MSPRQIKNDVFKLLVLSNQSITYRSEISYIMKKRSFLWRTWNNFLLEKVVK